MPHSDIPPTAESRSDTRVERALELIESGAGAGPGLGVGEIAHRLGLSASHLRRLFRLHGDRSPSEALRLARFNKARDLLATTNLSVKEVAFRVGYMEKNPSHFTRDFRERFGLSPANFRACRQPGQLRSAGTGAPSVH